MHGRQQALPALVCGFECSVHGILHQHSRSLLDASARALCPEWLHLPCPSPRSLLCACFLPPQVRLLLLVLINRHWAMHGPALTKCFPDTGTTQSQLVLQVRPAKGWVLQAHCTAVGLLAPLGSPVSICFLMLLGLPLP